MSNYRDDTQETAVASDRTFIGLNTITESIAKISDALFFSLLVMVASSAHAQDEVVDSTILLFSESAAIQDHVIDSNTATLLIQDGLTAKESLQHGLGFVVGESALVLDSTDVSVIAALTVETAVVSDHVVESRIARSFITDDAKITDSLTAITSDIAADEAMALDHSSDLLKACDLVLDSAVATAQSTGSVSTLLKDSALAADHVLATREVAQTIYETARLADIPVFASTDVIADQVAISDDAFGNTTGQTVVDDTALIESTIIDYITYKSIVSSNAKASDVIADKLIADVQIHTSAVINDEIVDVGGYYGQAWTANTSNWAMSRYSPCQFKRLAVINGALYGESDNGVYRLDVPSNEVTASITTAKIDLSNGELTHPSSAYLEYSIDGNAAMTVSSTQKGVEQQYTYMLPSEVAGELTNGRFIFGRGLRGRHFAFELIMIGTHGHINDLTIEHLPTNRRV